MKFGARNSVVCVAVVVVVVVAGGGMTEAAGAEQPECAKPCVNLPGVAQEVRRYITDEGETCTLDPKYKQCILDSCQTSTLPENLVKHLKQNYDCDLSGGTRTGGTRGMVFVMTIVLAPVLALLMSF